MYFNENLKQIIHTIMYKYFYTTLFKNVNNFMLLVSLVKPQPEDTSAKISKRSNKRERL